MRIPMHCQAVLACLLTLAAYNVAFAGKYNPTLDIGKPGPAWKKLPGVDGNEHSLEDLKKKDAIVVVFTCNSCPYAVDYEDRIIEFAKKHCAKESNVALVAINVNNVPEDSLAEMKKRAATKKFPFPYLFDETQKIADDYGATWTPEFFVLNKERKVVYMGAFDDNTDAKKAKVQYVADAVKATLVGQKVEIEEVAATGCAIRRKRRSRRKRKAAKPTAGASN